MTWNPNDRRPHAMDAPRTCATSGVAMMLTIDSMMATLDKTLEQEATHIDRVHGPLWEARAEVIRNLVSIGAAILAGTVTFLDSSPPTLAAPLEWPLIASWVLLLASISSGLFVLWQSVTLRSFYPKLFNSRPTIRSEFENLDLTQPTAPDQSAAILKRVVDGVVGPMGSADRRAQLSARICLISFFLSMIAFAIFAVARVLPEIRQLAAL